MATETGSTGAPASQPADVGLRREMGLIGATWASETSIIGSGWLFGALFAAQAAGTAALLGWVIAGVIVVILALVHAELGGMYPVSGGTARFPHFAFGSIAGISFGFFSWLQAVTVAPIECFAVMQYGSYYWHGLYNATSGNVTGLGFAMTIVLMAFFTAINFLAIGLFSKVNAGITWWKVAIPVLTIIVLLFKFHPSNFGAGGGFMPFGIKALFAAIPSAGIVFAYLGFEQADQLAGEIKDPQKNLPRAILIAVTIGIIDLRHAAGRVHRSHPAQPDLGSSGLGGHTQDQRNSHRAVRWPGGRRRARLARDPPAARRVHLAVRHRPDLPDFDLARRVRPGPQPLLPAALHQSGQPRRARGSA